MRWCFPMLALATLASCDIDWNRLDPTLGEGAGVMGGGGGTGAAGGAGGAGGAEGGAGGIDDPGGMGGSGGTAPFCGDNNVDPGEECDDGNDQSGDLCDQCVVECEGTKDPTTRHCYVLFEADRTWNVARDACLAWGGDLVSITDSDEHDLVNTLYGDTPGPYWIGGNDIAEHGTWVWSNGDPWGYVAWDDVDMEPNGGAVNSLQNCIDVYDNATAGPLFGDNACDETKPYVCERPPPP